MFSFVMTVRRSFVGFLSRGFVSLLSRGFIAFVSSVVNGSVIAFVGSVV